MVRLAGGPDGKRMGLAETLGYILNEHGITCTVHLYLLDSPEHLTMKMQPNKNHIKCLLHFFGIAGQ